jgi:voltage-gated potassium channel
VKRKHLSFADRIERFNIWRAIRLLVAADILLIFLAAFWIHLVEPSTFPNYGVSLWWSVVTVGTVGYGDVVPHTVAGRIAGATTIILTLALIPTITSLVVSALVEHRQRQRRSSDSITLDEIARRLAAIEAQLSGEQQDSM